MALGYLGRSEEAIREGERAVELRPVAKYADEMISTVVSVTNRCFY